MKMRRSGSNTETKISFLLFTGSTPSRQTNTRYGFYCRSRQRLVRHGNARLIQMRNAAALDLLSKTMKQKVLFICVHNSARSQMAEAFLNLACPDNFEAQSAGLEPGTLSPLAIEARKEIGTDIPGMIKQSDLDVFKLLQFFYS